MDVKVLHVTIKQRRDNKAPVTNQKRLSGVTECPPPPPPPPPSKFLTVGFIADCNSETYE